MAFYVSSRPAPLQTTRKHKKTATNTQNQLLLFNASIPAQRFKPCKR
ncbi:hypothetical protein IMZ68_07820 [Candidatus Bathyarchaeota archaeon]|nr:hypothetical protein [Candidatus Bathyarchaeota archaeon]